MKQHKWHKEIKAWADGAEIEWWNDVHQRWEIEKEPMWSCINKYRIKPQPVEPQYLYVYKDSFYGVDNLDSKASTRIMNKRVREFEANYIGKIPLIVESNDEV